MAQLAKFLSMLAKIGVQCAAVIVLVRAIGVGTAVVRLWAEGSEVIGAWFGSLFTLAVSAVVLAAQWSITASTPAFHTPRRWNAASTYALAIGTGAAVACIGLVEHIWTQALAHSVLRTDNLTAATVATVISAWVVQPAVLEEVGFRGYLLTRIREHLGPLWAIGISTLAFVVAHMFPLGAQASPLWLIAIGGVAFGLLLEVTKSVWAAIVAHFATNTITISVLSFLAPSFR
ncbi:MAG: lysostaphin resistance A-like protein [Gammaproteobacteria bacterium]